jgi:hypothetical protein
MSNAFCKEPEHYQRNLDPVRQAMLQSAQYISAQTGDPVEQCLAFIQNGIKNKTFEGMVNPTVVYYQKKENGDREETKSSLTGYIAGVIANNEILAPTFTSYVHSSVKKSILVGYLDKNKTKRDAAKKAMYVAQAEKNEDLFTHKNNEQTAKKLKSNSTSGAMCAMGSILHNPSGHSTLTSTTRSVSSLSNASNERVISGNRHYWSAKTALYNIISIVGTTNYRILRNAMERYSLHYPSTKDVMECVEYSSKLYWSNPKQLASIAVYVDKLTPIQKAAFVYSGDLFHVRKHNPAFVRRFVGSIAQRVQDTPVENARRYMEKLDEHTMALTHVICMDIVRGKGKNYEKMENENPAGVQTLAATAQNIIGKIDGYRDFIEAIFLSNNIPASTAYINHMIRRAVVLSDTDSTCFSVDEWLYWYYGSYRMDSETAGVSAVVAFIATQAIVHILAVLSGNMNVEKSRLHVLAMKNEFMWLVMATTSVAKHYYALTAIKEGNVYEKLLPEIKGVHLKNSSSPQVITDDAERIMMEVLHTVAAGNKIKIRPYLEHIVNTEQAIVASLLNGELTYYRRAKIKESAAYKKEATLSPYQHYLLWEQVFQQKYGSITPPPYGVVKIPTKLVNKTAVKNWLAGIKDREFAERMAVWFDTNKKVTLPTFYIPTEYLIGFGMIEELKPIIDTRRIVLDLTNVYRLILESLGIFMKNGYTLYEQNGLNWK